MALDPRYVTSVELESYFVDKDTGLPLSGGLVYFWSDNNRNSPKNVYQLSGSPPNYTYTPLPNPLTLSGVGTFQNNNGDNIAVYYLPYDSFGDVDNYFIQVYSAGSPPPGGIPQFTREAWPNVSSEDNPMDTGQGSTDNALSNPQFAEVLFDPAIGMSVTYIAGITEVDIAPDWTIVINAVAGGTLTIARTAIAGSQRLPTNPPYTLSITSGPNISDLSLRQRLPNNPDIWSAVYPGGNGFLSGCVLVGPSSGIVEMSYKPSTGTQQLILSDNNLSGNWKLLNATVQLLPGDNAQNADVGYVDILVSIPTAGTTRLSSIQVVGLDNDIGLVQFDQQTVNRQIDHLFHYYKSQLFYKEIPSYLVGWDFPLNPAQFSGDTVAATGIGANKSKYVWDQTIGFQSANSGLGVSRSPAGALRLTAAVATQFAIVQYLDATQARKILNDQIAVHIASSTNKAGGYVGTVSLWYTLDANLPNVAGGTNNSIVLTLDANGKPATFNGTWVEVSRDSLGNASFNVAPSATTNFNDNSFNGWNLNGAAAANTATFFAIVIGFAAVDLNDYIDIYSVGLCSGAIATRPSPQTSDEALRDCERYYEKSYAQGVVPTAITSVNALAAPMSATQVSGGNSNFVENSFSFIYRTLKRVVGPTVSLYSPTTGAINNVRAFAEASASNAFEDPIASWPTRNVGDKSAAFVATVGAGSGHSFLTLDATTPALCNILYHYVVDARLGIVN